MSFPKIFKSDSAKSELKDEILNPLITIQNWSNTVNYEPYTLIRKGGVLYFSKAASGPNTSAGAQDPANDTNHTYWSAISIDDSNVVHKSGNEVIDGEKTIIGQYTRQGSNISGVIIRNPLYTRKGTTPNENNFWGIAFCDNSLPEWDEDGPNGRMSILEGVIRSDGSNRMALVAYENDPDSQAGIVLGVGYDENGIPYAMSPATPDPLDRNSNTDILTRDWIPRDTRIVHTTGSENIFGAKTFKDCIYFLDRSALYNNIFDWANASTPYDQNYYSTLEFRDSKGVTAGYVENVFEKDSANHAVQLSIRKTPSTAIDSTDHLGLRTDGTTTWAFAPHPQSLSDSTAKIATTQWVRQATGEFACTAANARDLTSKRTALVKGANLNETYWLYSWITHETGTSADNPHRLAEIRSFVDKNGVCGSELMSYRYTANSNNNATLGIYIKSDGVGYAICPTPPATANNTNIATTEWVRTFHNGGTSDERVKSEIGEIPNEVLDAWGEVDFCQFKFNDAVQEKGSSARLHNGLVAQRLDKIFKDRNLDISKYGLYVHEVWETEEPIVDDKGNVMIEGRSAGDLYSIRYTEALCMEAAYQRRRADRAEARITALEEELSLIKSKLNL